jgi:hypothetical protein
LEAADVETGRCHPKPTTAGGMMPAGRLRGTRKGIRCKPTSTIRWFLSFPS